MDVHVERFGVMGTDGEVQVIGGDPALATRARARLDWLEARWSRFRPDSDISVLNANAGRAMTVEPETIALVERAVAAASATDGRYDPSCGAAVIGHGYDRTFAELPALRTDLAPVAHIDASWPAIEIDRDQATVRLPEQMVFDAGGIGKGFAADLVLGELAPEAAGLLVNLGGDMRVAGTAPHEAGWVITVDDPFNSIDELTRLAIPEGAVATSSTMRRRWETALGPAHHIIDPRTGRPADSGIVAATVVAAEGWWAEAHATSLLLTGPEGLLAVDGSCEALLVAGDGTIHATGAFQEVLV